MSLYLLFPFTTFIWCTFQVTEKYKLGNPTTFHYLNQSKCYQLTGVDEAKEYLATKQAMEVDGISSDEQVFIKVYEIFIEVC